MYCQSCGSKLKANAKYCSECGAPVAVKPTEKQPKRSSGTTADDMIRDGVKVTPNITLCPDGKYRWRYDMNLFTNPTFFLMIWKIFFFIILGIFAFMMLLAVFQGDMDGELFIGYLKFLGYFLLGMTALLSISMLIYALIMSGKYCVIFEMDDKGVLHQQIPSQAKKAKRIGDLTILAGVLSGRPSTVAAGLSSQRASMSSDFAYVRKVKACPRRHLIKVNERLFHNQVYAAKEDFDFVLRFILEHTPNAK